LSLRIRHHKICLLLLASLSAQGAKLTLKADQTRWQEEKRQFSAAGNVRLTNKDLTIKSCTLMAQTGKNRSELRSVTLSNDVRLRHDHYKIQGQAGYMDWVTQKGHIIGHPIGLTLKDPSHPLSGRAWGKGYFSLKPNLSATLWRIDLEHKDYILTADQLNITEAFGHKNNCGITLDRSYIDQDDLGIALPTLSDDNCMVIDHKAYEPQKRNQLAYKVQGHVHIQQKQGPWSLKGDKGTYYQDCLAIEGNAVLSNNTHQITAPRMAYNLKKQQFICEKSGNKRVRGRLWMRGVAS
jgi:lipopolysaccharide export system protein LptA